MEDETKEPVKPDVPIEEKKEETSTMITEAKEVADRMEKANAKREELVLRDEKILAEKALGGKTDAGSTAKTEEEKVTEGAKKLLEGTGYEAMFDDPIKKEV